MRIAKLICGFVVSLAPMLAAGCASAGGSGNVKQLSERATSCLRFYLPYEHLVTARVQALESLGECGGNEVLPWIRHAMNDEAPAVRFAAAMTLGQRGDRTSEANLRKLLGSGQTSDRIAAAGALHLLGDHRASGLLAEYLFDRNDAAARRHAAFVFGRLNEPGAIKILARAMSSKDPGLKANVLESMAILGAKEARATLVANVYNGLGTEETFALTVLGRLRESEYREIFLDKLGSAQHLETKLAAARALGLVGGGQGLELARSSLGFTAAKDEKGDPAANQTFRVRQLAASALGAIGHRDALLALERMMNESDDPRLQIAAAKAILDTLGPKRKKPRIR
ncbi:MAG: HEAT repeat domain-containing protein [Planctomycetes bacterium]|nr:HEAT repeat domain-containing protein [Planctomycetota bacterium]